MFFASQQYTSAKREPCNCKCVHLGSPPDRPSEEIYAPSLSRGRNAFHTHSAALPVTRSNAVVQRDAVVQRVKPRTSSPRTLLRAQRSTIGRVKDAKWPSPRLCWPSSWSLGCSPRAPFVASRLFRDSKKLTNASS